MNLVEGKILIEFRQNEEDKVVQLTREMLENLEDHQKGLGKHCRSVIRESFLFAVYLGFSRPFIEGWVDIASAWHDAGKLLIAPNILDKPGKLSRREIVLMEDHSEYTGSIMATALGTNSIMAEHAGEVAMQVHEHMDGGGYPAKLKGEQISYWARLVSICDTFSALVHQRPYKKALSTEVALQLMHRLSFPLVENDGIVYDPQLLEKYEKYVRSGERRKTHDLWNKGVFALTRPYRLCSPLRGDKERGDREKAYKGGGGRRVDLSSY